MLNNGSGDNCIPTVSLGEVVVSSIHMVSLMEVVETCIHTVSLVAVAVT